MKPNLQLTRDGELLKDLERYRRLVGKLNDLAVTRPNIVYSEYYELVYVRPYGWSLGCIGTDSVLSEGCSWHGLLYKDYGQTNIECFSDADWVGS